MKLQQPRNCDFRVSQFNPPRSRSGNNRETTTSPPGHHWEANITLTTTTKLQQLRVNSREMTTFAESCNDRKTQRPRSDKLETAQLLHILRQILRRFMVVVVSSAFWKSLSKWLFPKSASSGVLRFRVCFGALLEGNKEHPKMQHTRKRSVPERSHFCVFRCFFVLLINRANSFQRTRAQPSEGGGWVAKW